MPDQNTVNHRKASGFFLGQPDTDPHRLHLADERIQIFRISKGIVFRYVCDYRNIHPGLLSGFYQPDEAVHFFGNQAGAGNQDFSVRLYQISLKYIRIASGIIDGIYFLLFNRRIGNDPETDLFIGLQSFLIHSIENRDVGIDIIIHNYPFLSVVFPAQPAHILLQPSGKGDRSRQHQGVQPGTVEAFPDFLSGGYQNHGSIRRKLLHPLSDLLVFLRRLISVQEINRIRVILHLPVNESCLLLKSGEHHRRSARFHTVSDILRDLSVSVFIFTGQRICRIGIRFV